MKELEYPFLIKDKIKNMTNIQIKNEYDYLIKMPLCNMCKEEIDNLNEKKSKSRDRIKKITKQKD